MLNLFFLLINSFLINYDKFTLFSVFPCWTSCIESSGITWRLVLLAILLLASTLGLHDLLSLTVCSDKVLIWRYELLVNDCGLGRTLLVSDASHILKRSYCLCHDSATKTLTVEPILIRSASKFSSNVTLVITLALVLALVHKLLLLLISINRLILLMTFLLYD